jgi:hypothetical protein
MGDIIQELPIDDLPPTNDEKDMIQWMFPEKKESPESMSNSTPKIKMTSKFHFEVKVLFVIIILYILFTNSYTDWIFHKVIPFTSKSNILLIGIKSILFSLLLFILLNIYYK